MGTKKGTGTFNIDVWLVCTYAVGYATRSASFCRRHLLPRHEPGQWPPRGIPQGRRLPGLPRGHRPCVYRDPYACPRVLPDAQSLSSGGLAERRRGSEPLDALGAQYPCSPLPPVLSHQRPITARQNGASKLPGSGAGQAAALLARLGQSNLEGGRVGGGAAMREPWRAVRQRRLGGKDGEAFRTAVYSAAPQSASKVDEINVPSPCVFISMPSAMLAAVS